MKIQFMLHKLPNTWVIIWVGQGFWSCAIIGCLRYIHPHVSPITFRGYTSTCMSCFFTLLLICHEGSIGEELTSLRTPIPVAMVIWMPCTKSTVHRWYWWSWLRSVALVEDSHSPRLLHVTGHWWLNRCCNSFTSITVWIMFEFCVVVLGSVS